MDQHRKSLLRIYADTSVFGGCFDNVFELDSLRFFRSVLQGSIRLLTSEVVERELAIAPERVRQLFDSLPDACLEDVLITGEVTRLRHAYLSAAVVGKRSSDDATHVAAATVASADAIVSWDLKHIVRHDQIRGYNQVNRRLGYGPLQILTPKMVRLDDEA